MSIHVALHHRTSYRYDRPVGHGPHVVRLRPAPHCRSRILAYSLKVGPGQHFLNWQQDPLSNHLARLVFPDPMDRLDVEVDLVVEMSVQNPFDFFLEPGAEQFPFRYDPAQSHELAPFLNTQPASPRLQSWIAAYRHRRCGVVNLLVEINAALQSAIQYRIRLEPGVQSPEETLTLKSGSCRDSAWLLVNLLRHLGLAARFVSGYLIQLKPDVKPLDGPAGTEVDFTDLHAWAEVYLPGAGWIGLDPTSGLLAGEGHLPLACSPDPLSAAPITGGVDPCESTMEHDMRVTRIFESPRTTQPYQDDEWHEILASGRKTDARLREMDVRLTMGGEPTFVSMDDVDGEEWNTAAVGPEKRRLSGELIRRLRSRFAPGGVLFFGQGKWYPGEPLPRWSYNCYWRKDGQPAWHDDRWIASPTQDYGHGNHEALAFATALARSLGVQDSHLMPAYEDVYYHLWKERSLPANVDPLQSNLKDPLERDRLRRIFQRGLGEVVGYALPLQAGSDGNGTRWDSGPWFLRDEHLYLLPGDSPMGFRLPLDSLPWVAESEYPWILPADPSAPFPPLPTPRAILRGQSPLDNRVVPADRSGDPDKSPQAEKPTHGQSAPWIVRTAICFEPREGRLHLFLPPLPSTEDFLDLVARIEETSSLLEIPVILEGTPPPWDPRLEVVKVTPDPGVIEVNLHPAKSWDELVDHTSVLYDEARQCRLATEKFMIDGRHCGTGGGNHIILGGETPQDSPLLRRPDLLRSMITFWNHHPSLSYLFSGLFVGPTSQAPRVDEARNDSIHELEIAFRTLTEHARGNSPTSPPPWQVDRALRNLLIDATGNTHRAEFCIDKLYSPDSATGRLGLLEMRNFEMPPHPRMSLAQHLVLRALVARFWEHPYEKPLVRWDSTLHDRWMLPHFIREDFRDVLNDLRSHDYDVRDAWFAPHLEFRFPKIGDFSSNGVEVELRHAIEPWHVLGEEGSAGGTVRYVDSSVERMQVLVRGLTQTRHILCCNGWKLPLHPTGTQGEAVAGIRYRAWQPPNCLHPTIPVHTPLAIELADTWNDVSLGGCTYHAAHPGGRNHDTFPVNSYEAEARRMARFFRQGHTGGTFHPRQPPISPDFPLTLDLRLCP